MEITLGQQYNVGEKPTVILYTYITRYAGTPENYCIKSTELRLCAENVQLCLGVKRLHATRSGDIRIQKRACSRTSNAPDKS